MDENKSLQPNGQASHTPQDVEDQKMPLPEKHQDTGGEERVSDESIGKYIPVPPDGGYGWVIMFASFICNVLVDGVCFCFGIFYLEFLEYYGDSKSKTSWVGSVLNGMYLSMGPITSALANKFGCRAVTIAGSIIACIAFFISTYSPNIDILILTFGGLGGMGFGLMYLPAIVMVGYYFEKKRAFATGVAVCGSGIGAFVFAPMCEALLKIYDWKGAVWILAGITLNGVVVGALFRPLEAPAKIEKRQRSGTNENTKAIRSLDNIISSTENGILKTTVPAEVQPRDVVRYRMMYNLIQTIKDEKAVINGDIPKETEEPATEDPTLTMRSMYDLSPSRNQEPDPLKGSSAGYFSSVPDLYVEHKNQRTTKQQIKALSKPIARKDIFYGGSVANLDEYKEANEDLDAYRKSMASIELNKQQGNGNCCKSFCASFQKTIDFSLLLDPVFAIYGLACFLTMTGFYVPFTFLPDYAISEGIKRDNAAFLLSIIGIANTVARVLVGWVSDQSWADCLLINNCALIMGGAVTMMCTLFKSYGLLAGYSTLFGISIAIFVSLRSILMVEMMGLEKLTNSFGLVTMCQGLSAFIGAPIAGWLYDITGEYSASFYVAGACLALAGIICLPLRKIARWQKRKEDEKVLRSRGSVNSKANEYLISNTDINAVPDSHLVTTL